MTPAFATELAVITAPSGNSRVMLAKAGTHLFWMRKIGSPAREAFLFEMAAALLGFNYPKPPRALLHTEKIVKAYRATGVRQ